MRKRATNQSGRSTLVHSRSEARASECCCFGVQVLARAEGVPLVGVRVAISGELDPDRPVRPDVSVFSAVRLRFELEGVTSEEGDLLVKRFKGR
jgi:hypothetical protein